MEVVLTPILGARACMAQSHPDCPMRRSASFWPLIGTGEDMPARPTMAA
jgi:hypothetical protein